MNDTALQPDAYPTYGEDCISRHQTLMNELVIAASFSRRRDVKNIFA